MVKTTQEFIDGAAARFAADNAIDDTVMSCVAALLELERQDNGYLHAVAEARRAGVTDVEPIYRDWKPRRVEAAKKLYEWTEEEVEQAENAVAAMRTKAKDDAFRNAVTA